LKNQLFPLPSPDHRSVGTQSPNVTRFVESAYNHLVNNHVFKQFANFASNIEIISRPWETANKLDDMLGQAFSLAKKKCYKTPRPPWSDKLYYASLKVRYWRTALTAHRTNVDHSITLADITKKIWCDDPPPPIPRNLRALQSVTRAAQRALC
jgi:hypothetical protein